jgi:plasmid stabilization system protein ParE
VIFYLTRPGGIDIVAVLHRQMDISTQFDRPGSDE